jgi:predicted DsbA family dithiol-disulfide isomerase
MQREYDVTIRWRTFPLHPDIPPSGMDYVAYFGGEGGWQAGAQQLGAMAEALGLPFEMPLVKYNSRRAEELTAWAVTNVPDMVEDLRTATFQAIWAEGRNNDDPDVLADVAASVGIPRGAAVEALEHGKGRAAVDEDWRESMTRGIRGVPVVFIGEQAIMGAQPWPVFAGTLDRAGVTRRGA